MVPHMMTHFLQQNNFFLIFTIFARSITLKELSVSLTVAICEEETDPLTQRLGTHGITNKTFVNVLEIRSCIHRDIKIED